MMAGDATPAQMAGLLMALRVRGETVDEITAGAQTLRERMAKISAPAGAIDTCGTGGDGSGTFNISTAAALVVAGRGVPVAKHGNRGLSSRSGSSDVLTALGVNIDAPFPAIERAIREAGIGFMMAPRHHGAMRHVAGPRVELGTRTIFNLLGPLANPAGVKRQVVGVFVGRLARAAGAGARAGSAPSGPGSCTASRRLDELTTAGTTHVAEWDRAAVRRFRSSPRMPASSAPRSPTSRAAMPRTNAAAIRAMLAGIKGPLPRHRAARRRRRPGRRRQGRRPSGRGRPGRRGDRHGPGPQRSRAPGRHHSESRRMSAPG